MLTPEQPMTNTEFIAEARSNQPAMCNWRLRRALVRLEELEAKATSDRTEIAQELKRITAYLARFPSATRYTRHALTALIERIK